MTRPTRAAVAVLACCLAGAVLGGCTSGDDEPDPTPPGPTDAAPDPTEPALPPPGAMDEFQSLIHAFETETAEARQQRLAEMEQILAACMAEQGFEYTPVDWSYIEDQEERRGRGNAPEITEDPAASVAEYGYGISTQVPGVGDAQGFGPGGGHVDPNEEYVAAMSDAERRAYETALMGVGQGEAYVTGEEPYDWTQWGCQGRSDHQLGIDQREFFDDTPYQDLRAEINAMYLAVGDDPRVLEAEREWSACMAEAGYSGLNRVADAMEGILAQSNRIWAETSGAVVLDLTTTDYLTSPEYLAAAEENARRHADLAEIEIPTAVADYACQDEVGYSRRRAEISVELQREFYDAHRTELEAWLTAFEEFQATH